MMKKEASHDERIGKEAGRGLPIYEERETLKQQRAENYVDDLYSAFGVECRDGWYDLITELCEEIMKAYTDEGRPMDLVVDQIKEKYGTLRFYYHFGGQSETIQSLDVMGVGGIRMMSKSVPFEDKIASIVAKYEEKSAHICEDCGSPGVLRPDLGWVLTLCDACYEQKV